MDFSQPTTLGRTGLQVGRLGIASANGKARPQPSGPPPAAAL